MPTLADGLIHGFVAPGFELVQEEFINNFTKRGEVGAAISVFIDNEVVVDLWAAIEIDGHATYGKRIRSFKSSHQQKALRRSPLR